jgi:antirestriction protein ArdC
MSNTVVYEMVTEQLVKLLESGLVPWRKPWVSAGVPRNAVSKRSYRGINSFLLGLTPYSDPRWLTFKQAKELGGNVKRGESSTVVVFWKLFDVVDEETQEKKRIPLLRYYRVFNVEQCEGLKLQPLEREESLGKAERLAECERVVSDMPQAPALFDNGGDRAYYNPRADSVHMPRVEQFKSTEGYYSTLFHELTHSTGHESRLNRPGITQIAAFGDAVYSREELVAEFGASFLCNLLGISSDGQLEQSASYIKGWLSALKNDKKLAVVAAAQAQKAADFILGVGYGADDSDEDAE